MTGLQRDHQGQDLAPDDFSAPLPHLGPASPTRFWRKRRVRWLSATTRAATATYGVTYRVVSLGCRSSSGTSPAWQMTRANAGQKTDRAVATTALSSRNTPPARKRVWPSTISNVSIPTVAMWPLSPAGFRRSRDAPELDPTTRSPRICLGREGIYGIGQDRPSGPPI